MLLAVQPSSLAPQQMDNFIAAVKSGQPTAIFEDPFPWIAPDVPGTKAPKQPPGGGNPFMQQRSRRSPRATSAQLWKLLGVDFSGDNVVWQDYNPMPKLGGFITREWVFVDHGSGAKQPFNTDNSITSKLQQVLFLFPGSVDGLNSSPLKFTELVSTSDRTGTIRYDQILERSFMGQPRMNPEMPLLEKPTNEQVRAGGPDSRQAQGREHADVRPRRPKRPPDEASQGPPTSAAKADEPKAEATPRRADAKAGDDKSADAKQAGSRPKPIRRSTWSLVSDIDCLYGAFFALRARGDDPDDEFDFNFDNVPFVLNVLDVLAGDERFVDIRTRRPVASHADQGQREHRKGHASKPTRRARSSSRSSRTPGRRRRRSSTTSIAELKKRHGREPAAGHDRDPASPAGRPAPAGHQARTAQADSATARSRSRERKLAQDGPRACRTATSCGPCCCRRFRR